MSTPKPTVRRRGQATVEMAILMLVLVPTFLYVLTADDLLRYRLNLQEVVVASPWDYTHLDYEPGNVPGNALVERLQQTYENINLVYSADTSDADKAADNAPSRTAPMTFAGWDVEGSQRVDCTKNDNIAAELNASSSSAQALAPQVNHGGLYICNAALFVSNVRLITDFLQDWVTPKLSDKAKDEAWGLNRQHFSVLAGTWAMTGFEDVEPSSAGRGKTLQSRVSNVYAPVSGEAVARAVQLVKAASQILSPIVLLDSDEGLGDDTGTPEVGFSSHSPPRIQANGNPFDSSPWRHKGARGGTYEQAYSSRESTYMGRALP